ncbi:MAG: DUF374 domain-containing protein [Planctomycetes bacterium]|nr:DUF374 domain-containing protein [Planctomycetota bacterium]
MAPLARHGRWRVVDPHGVLARARAGAPFVFAVWHEHALPLIAFFYRYYILRGLRITTLVSPSGDGRLIARVISDLGGDIAAGSSSRRALAGMRGLVRAVRLGQSGAITVDGPKGPRRTVKEGIVALAHLTGAPIVPLAAGVTLGVRFASWDRFLVPWWTAGVTATIGEPVEVPRHAPAALLSERRLLVQRRLLALCARLDPLERHVLALRPPTGGRRVGGSSVKS